MLVVAFCGSCVVAGAVTGVAVGVVVMAGATVLGTSVEGIVLALAGATVVRAVIVRVVKRRVDVVVVSHIGATSFFLTSSAKRQSRRPGRLLLHDL